MLLFPAGTGYGSDSSASGQRQGWDLDAYVAAQKEKDEQTVVVLQVHLQTVHCCVVFVGLCMVVIVDVDVGCM